MLEALTLPFFQRVLIAGLLASLACGVLGTFIVAKRISSISGGLAHAAFGGVGLGYLIGISPMLGAAGFGVLSALAIGLGARRMGAGLDTWISILWALGMALGIVFVALTPGYVPDLMSYLFGSLLFVSWHYVLLVGVLDLAIAAVVLCLFKELQAVSFDEEFSEVMGLPVEKLFLALLVLIALGIVTLIRVVGVILVIALLTVPAAIARHWTADLRRMMVVAIAVSVACTSAGLLLSYSLGNPSGAALSLPPGPLAILLAVALYALSGVARRVAGRG
ncbi:MAG: metal ABC transporter permease [Myxococcales bacterium]|nr:metal ABC transporter permease [Myxococcales bacterium]MDH5306127.1 metal ABC transporter permease [Myxococcales bacterium]MDH5565540.1 metal ABC transporter permease [Myxococcales bacterium]